MSGRLYGIGVGPGDPELLTLKAHRILQSVAAIAWPQPQGGKSLAREIAAASIPSATGQFPIILPMCKNEGPAQAAYDAAADSLSGLLERGEDVAVLCEGDPLFYGSFIHLLERLGGRFPVEIVPGVTSFAAGAAAIGLPLATRNERFSVIPATLPNEQIRRTLEGCEGAAIIKLGRHLSRIRLVVTEASLADSAWYLERIGMPGERFVPLCALRQEDAPYFSLLLISRRKAVIAQGTAT